MLKTPEPGIADLPVAGPDLKQVKGQETAKRALEIAAAGGHNLLMSGPPGAGKSLLASCLPGILPELTPAEALGIYERNARHLVTQALQPSERNLIDALRLALGDG